jgi:murein DD-endopeptidase MepM/ murein hydrolase activator NlpD
LSRSRAELHFHHHGQHGGVGEGQHNNRVSPVRGGSQVGELAGLEPDLPVFGQAHAQRVGEQFGGQRRPVPEHLDQCLVKGRWHGGKLSGPTDKVRSWLREQPRRVASLTVRMGSIVVRRIITRAVPAPTSQRFTRPDNALSRSSAPGLVVHRWISCPQIFGLHWRPVRTPPIVGAMALVRLSARLLAVFGVVCLLTASSGPSALGAVRPRQGAFLLAPSKWTWPLAGTPTVTRTFEPPPRPWLPGHRGVDLAGQAGQPVLAAGAGIVAYAGVVVGRGVVSVDRAGGLRTTYEPVRALVRTGQTVSAGQAIGELDAGHSGCPVAACLHWGLRRGETYLDPLALLHPPRLRLKPLVARGLPTGLVADRAVPRPTGRSPRRGCRSGPTAAISRGGARRRPRPRSGDRPRFSP